jgi:hypothetical protein
MANEATRIDISSMPDLARLVREVERTRTPWRLEDAGKTVALLVPAGRNARRRKPVRLVDTSSLPPVPHRTIDELIASRPPGPPPRAFTDEEIKTALEEDRVDRWRRKSS